MAREARHLVETVGKKADEMGLSSSTSAIYLQENRGLALAVQVGLIMAGKRIVDEVLFRIQAVGSAI